MVIEIRESVVHLSGALCGNHWLAVRAAAHMALQGHPHGIVIDCEGLGHVTDEGAQTFATALLDIEAADLPIVITHLPQSIAMELGRTMADRFYHDTADSAEAARISQAIYSNLWWERLWGNI